MGLIASTIFPRKKTTAEVVELLDLLEKDINIVERDMMLIEHENKRNIGFLKSKSVWLTLIILFSVVLFYNNMYDTQSLYGFLYVLPVIVLLIAVRFGLSKYYKISIINNRRKLDKFIKEKRMYLEEVKNTEKYKVAKDILDKYGSNEIVDCLGQSHSGYIPADSDKLKDFSSSV